MKTAIKFLVLACILLVLLIEVRAQKPPQINYYNTAKEILNTEQQNKLNLFIYLNQNEKKNFEKRLKLKFQNQYEFTLVKVGTVLYVEVYEYSTTKVFIYIK
tara:strand:- start:6293 stop:6598 length:306 start_codon:yes stop_codon:yes gene_type:complete